MIRKRKRRGTNVGAEGRAHDSYYFRSLDFHVFPFKTDSYGVRYARRNLILLLISCRRNSESPYFRERT